MNPDGTTTAAGQGVAGGVAAPPVSPAPSTQPTPTSTAPSQTTQPSSSGGIVGQGGTSGGQGGTAPVNPAAAQTVRDALAGYGVDLRTQFQDDRQALQHLASIAQQAQQMQQYLPYAQEYMQNAQQFRLWQAEQQRQQQQAAQQQQQSWWQAPEYDARWQSQLYRDAQGNLQVLPGNDPAIIGKYNAWVNHQQNFLNNFSRDPLGAIGPGIQQMVQQQAQQLIQQQMSQMQDHQLATSFISQNSEWLHARDQAGNVVRDPRTGQPTLSSYGRQFAQYVSEAEQMGLRDSASQQRYALKSLQLDYLVAKLQGNGQTQGSQGAVPQPPQQSQAEQLRNNFLLQAQGQAGNIPGGGTQPTQGQHVPPEGMGVRGLMSRMMKDLAANGIQAGQQLIDR